MRTELFKEILESLRRNKLRTFLTGFSIAWGIFILMILLASGNGLRNGTMSNFSGASTNTVTLYANYTSLPYGGHPKDRPIKMDESDLMLLDHAFYETENVVPVYQLGYKKYFNKKETADGNLLAVTPHYFNTRNIDYGRTFNPLDISQERKVMILPSSSAKLLFGKEDAVGKTLMVDDVSYTVVGVYSNSQMSWRTQSYIPLSTALSIYVTQDRLREIQFNTVNLTTKAANEVFGSKLRMRLSKKHNYDPNDYSAIYIDNNLLRFLEVMTIFSALNIFLWIIGIGTLISGIVGVSNITLITVKERTKEFGIRKALGAKPSSVIRLVITESLVITGIFGYIGLLFGVIVTEIVNKLMESVENTGNINMTVFQDATIDLGLAISATVVMIIAGVLAGYFPARRAVSIKPIEALRYE